MVEKDAAGDGVTRDAGRDANRDGVTPERRHREILRRAAQDGVVRVAGLAKALGVHPMTVRRDLDALAEKGLLERVHGGARLDSKAGGEVSHRLRAAKNVEEKARIAQAALSLIKEGETAAFDASTTVLALVKLLGAGPLNAVLISLDSANALAGAGVPFILVGGTFHAPARSFVGTLATSQLARLHTDKVFFSCKGLSARAGYTDAHLPEVEAKVRLIATAKEVVALVDGGKFGDEALGTIATLEEVDTLVTDRRPPRELERALEEAGTRLIIADES